MYFQTPKFFKKLIQQGILNSTDLMTISKIRLVNALVLFTVAILTVLILVNLYFGIYSGVIITISSVVFLLLVLHLNRKGYHTLAATFFVNFCCISIFLASYLAYNEGRYTNTEGIIYTFIGLSIFLFDNKWRLAQFLFLVVMLLSLETMKWFSQYGGITPEYYLLIINVIIVVGGLYFFLNIFKKTLLKSLQKTNENQDILFSLIDNVPIFIGLEGRDRRYKMVNEKYVKVFGKPREEIIGARSKDILSEHMQESHTKYLDRAFSGELVEFLDKTRLPDGSVVYASGKFVPILNSYGKVEYVTVYVDDVTKLKNVEYQLKIELKDKDKLFSIIAHDIRSPLNLFEGLLNASDNEVLSQEEFLVFKEKLRERFISLQETINGLLEWSRLQLDRIQPTPIVFDPSKVITELINVFKPIAESKHINISQTGEGLDVKMDINHFRIIFRNLLHNALKFTPNGGEINISYASGDTFKIAVSDTGVGMSEEAIRKVLSKEDMTSTTGTMGETGTGLGLNLSLELLEKNGGTMDIQRGGGGGTKFLISIPVLSDQLSGEITSATTA